MLAEDSQLTFSAKSPPPKKVDTNRKYLLPHEIDLLMKAAKTTGRHRNRDVAIILMMFRHGLRSAELVYLKWQHIDLMGGNIDITRVKGSNDGRHPLRNEELRLLRKLERNYPETQYVFVSELKTPLTTRTVRHIIQRCGEKAGFKFPVHPHQLRHACGHYLASQGHDTRAIQDYLGHKNIHHTVRYTQMSPQRFEKFWND